LSKKISEEISELITIMLVNLSDEYPEISKELTKIVNLHKINITEDRKQIRLWCLYKLYPGVFDELLELLKETRGYQDENTSFGYASTNWDRIGGVIKQVSGSYASKYEKSFELQPGVFDNV
jgi:hypothetical protein